MSRILHALLAGIWCLYGIAGLTHSTGFWASIFGIDLPHMSMMLTDAVYYLVSIIMCPYYIRKAWLHFSIYLQKRQS